MRHALIHPHILTRGQVATEKDHVGEKPTDEGCRSLGQLRLNPAHDGGPYEWAHGQGCHLSPTFGEEPHPQIAKDQHATKQANEMNKTTATTTSKIAPSLHFRHAAHTSTKDANNQWLGHAIVPEPALS